MILLVGILPAGSLLICPGPAQAANRDAAPASIRLISTAAQVQPGRPFTLGVLFKIQKGWHIYWQYAGDAGLPPEIRWKVPEGWQVGPIQWPLPEKFTEKGPLTTYGYRDSVLLMAQVTPPTELGSSSTATFGADADWLVCHNECIPGKGTASLTLPVSSDPRPVAPGSAGDLRFRPWRQQLPLDTRSAGLATTIQMKKADDSGKIATVTLNITPPGGKPVAGLDWYPSPSEDFAVKKISHISEKGQTVFSFLFQSFKGPIPPGTRLESLVVYRDGTGRRRGVKLLLPLDFNS